MSNKNKHQKAQIQFIISIISQIWLAWWGPKDVSGLQFPSALSSPDTDGVLNHVEGHSCQPHHIPW